MICKHCGSEKFQKRGELEKTFMGMKQTIRRYQCKKCGRFVQSDPLMGKPAKVLLLDIETIPGLYYKFDPYPQYMQPHQVYKKTSIVCWAAKWLFDSKIIGQSVTPKEAISREEGSILEGIWDLINEAQVVVAHNGKNFDIKMLNTEFLLYGYPPPSPYMNVDTLEQARKVFKFPYNRLDELGKELGIGKKKEMQFPDWAACAEGSKEHLNKMLDYCKNDIAPLLEDVYLRMLPWMKSHPNLGIYSNYYNDVCPRCQSDDLIWGQKYPTPSGLWWGWRCNNCGSSGRGHGKMNKLNSVFVSAPVPA